jgi:hypothetical protein
VERTFGGEDVGQIAVGDRAAAERWFTPRRALVYCDAAMLPSTATPNAAPSSRVASFIAEPAPARRAGTADMIAAVIGDIESAMPETSGIRLIRMNQYGVCNPMWKKRSRPPAMHSIPNATVRFAPKRAVRRGVSGDTMIMIGAIGSRRSAAPSGEYPSTSWKYCVIRNMTPNIERNTSIIPPLPVLKLGLRK